MFNYFSYLCYIYIKSEEMGKIIKLTEGDLHRIVKKVLTEDNPRPEGEWQKTLGHLA